MISPSSIVSINSGQHYSFTSGQNKWNLMSVDDLLFMTMTNQAYPSRHAFALLDELQRTFVAKVGAKAETAREGGLSGETKSLSTKLCEKYDDLREIDAINRTMAKVDEVKLVMQENVEIALQNCVTLEHIEKQAEDLEQGAAVFKTRAKDLRSKMWWKKLKMQLLLASIIIIILTAVGLGIYFATKGDDDDDKKDKEGGD